MANLLQTSQNQTTNAPSFYTNYLSNLATAGQKAQACAQYVGAQPLQTQAFTNAANQAGQYQPLVSQGAGLVGQGANQNITGAAAPYLSNIASPLCAAKPLINQGVNFNLGQTAQCYMNPYIQCQINAISNIGQRNIMQNLAPQATAAAVGSGQFGSQRGAQVLGQTIANAEQCLNSNIANMLASGYGQALQAAGTKQGALSQLAGTTATAQQAQNAALNQAAQTAAQAAQQQGALGIQGGQTLGTLGTQGQQINLGCLNALSTLGGQQQTIAQNRQCYPLTTLSKLSTLLAGANIPTSTQTTLCMSPIQATLAAGAGIGSLFATPTTGGQSAYSNILSQLGFKPGSGGTGVAINPGSTAGGAASGIGTNISSGSSSGGASAGGAGYDPNSVQNPYAGCCCGVNTFVARGGLINAPVGCTATKHRGALPGRG